MNINKELKELMQNVLEELKSHWDFYQHRMYLKKKGWTEEQYQNYEDPDRNIRAVRIKDYYFGYQHTHAFTTTRTLPWTEFANWMDCYEQMNAWCKANCRGKFRSDILRVIKQTGIGLNGDTEEVWELNDIGGGDALFYAFKDSRDFTMFCLRWA
jgi:hypothetical protein